MNSQRGVPSESFPSESSSSESFSSEHRWFGTEEVVRGDFSLNDWLVQPQLNLLTRGDRDVHIEPKAMQVLVFLAGSPDEVVSKQVLKKQVWTDAYVTDDVLVRCISELRKALEDDPRKPHVIQTIPRGGYRLIAAVALTPEAPPAADALPSAPAEPSEDVRPSDPVPVPQKKNAARFSQFVLVGSIFALFTVLILVFWVLPHFANSGGADAPIASLAVLPLKNFSGDPEQDYFADAMTEALISDLARLGTLQVTSRTSVMGYKASTLPISAIARQLKVDALIEGSVMPVGQRVRITAQLIDGRTDRHLWSETYEREYKDILILQKEVARAVVEEIRTTLTPEEEQKLAKAEPVNPGAYQAYVKGRYFWNQRSRDSLLRATEFFEHSVKVAPDFGLAYSGLADTYNLLAHYGFRDPDDSFRKSKAAAQKALELDPSAAEPHASLALISMSYERNWKAAEEGFRKAIRLNPGYPTSHHWLALCLIGQGRAEQAIEEAEAARDLDPISLAPNTFLAQCLLLARRYAEAEQKCLENLELHPDSEQLRLILTESYWRQGKIREALNEIDKVMKRGREDGQQLAITRAIIAGKRAEAVRLFQHYLNSGEGRTNPMFCAQTHALLGENDLAFRCLNEAFNRWDSSLLIIKVDPTFDGLKQDPRFAQLTSRLGLG
ncbi:MAG: hypothetical protein EHM61_16710 [Acidobacteria bacterium]|nr:MAG: hypothetical protein EHM61_16710 [Acidobacteriota bacterium]